MSERICVFGEVLFDHFPDGQTVLGGAPFNVAWHLQAWELEPHLISRVGQDEQGKQVHQAMLDWGMDTSGLQFDPIQATGRVSVSIEDNEPHYDIVAPVAFDRIVAPENIPDCALMYHGSLALRDPVSRRSLDNLIGDSNPRIFVDVNLRDPWWQLEDVLALVERAAWVKLNEDELQRLLPECNEPERASRFLHQHQLEGLILTRGAQGAECLMPGTETVSVKPVPAENLVDTVGAGDAFASVIVCGLVRQWPISTTLERAQAFASAIVGQRGATVPEGDFYRAFISQWQD